MVHVKTNNNISPKKYSENIETFFFVCLDDRNYNLNSHIRIFWKSRKLNPHPYRGVELFWEGDYYWDECPSGVVAYF